MSEAVGIGSILIGSRDPERLASWYTDAFSATPNEQGVYEFGGVSVLFELRDDVSVGNGEPGRHILNFHVPDAATHAQLLDDMGATWLVPVEERDVGWFGTLLDPDGNYVQIIQFKPEYSETSQEILRERWRALPRADLLGWLRAMDELRLSLNADAA